jgi:hypothetical protein
VYQQDTFYNPELIANHDPLLKVTTQRGLGLLRNRPECSEFVSVVDRVLGDTPYSMQMALVRTQSPATDVLCHGDFCRNNVLYKYDVSSVTFFLPKGAY